MVGGSFRALAACALLAGGLLGAPLYASVSAQDRPVDFKAPPHTCDSLAANPLDPGRVGTGMSTALLRPEPAIRACEEAVKLYPNELRFQFQLGRAYRQAERMEDALRWYTVAAEKGYAGAQNSLGVMYARGEGVPENCAKAATYFQLAISHGYPAASENMRTLACVRQV